jgi:hypothetical protein
MKSRFYLTLFALLAVALVIPWQQASAQATLQDTVSYAVGDTMYVACFHSNFNLRVNALRSTILGDTAADGTRKNLNRVYKLKINGTYLEADDITNPGFPLTIVADPMDKIPATDYPAMIQIADDRGDGTGSARHLITAGASVTLKNLYISGRANVTGASANAYQPIVFAASHSRYVIDGCVFENSNFALVVFTGANNSCIVTNNKFRNLQEHPVTQQYTGRGISIWADQDTAIIENNTFFNLGFITFQMEGGSAKYLRYNHNTIVSVGRGLMSNSGNWWQNAYFANNLIIDGWWEGERFADINGSSRDPRQKHNGLFNIGVLPSGYGPNQGRRIVVTNNYAFLSPEIKAKYHASGQPDSIVAVTFMDNVSALDYAIPYVVGGAKDGHVFIGDTAWLSSLPAGFTNYLADANWLKPKYAVTGATMPDSMWKFITNIYAGITQGTEVFYHPEVQSSDQTWPLPENCSYSTSDPLYTKGSDGLPVGDLNWFPSKKAAFESGKAGFVSAIEQKAGKVFVYPIDSTLEAEKATVGGTAAVAAVQGLTYYDYIGNGKIEWSFTAPTAGLYDTKWLLNMTGRGQSGPDLAINNTQFVDRAHGWGQFVMDPLLGPAVGLSKSAWVFVPIVAESVKVSSDGSDAASLFTFAAGETKTIGVVGGGWGDVKFAAINIVKRGNTDTTKLKAPDAVVALVTPGAEGVIWVASGFKYVSLGTAGTITANLKAPTAGTYHLRTFYQNVGSAQSIQIKEGSTVLSTESFPGKADQTGLDNFSAGFTLTAGSHTITLSGANVNLDVIQMLGEQEVLGVSGKDVSPYTFALAQNFPNPFNPTTTINYSLGKASNVTLAVYNVLGQRVATLADGYRNAGLQSVVFDANKFASGVYFYRLEAGAFVKTEKMMLLK